jgi:hypothetical protein
MSVNMTKLFPENVYRSHTHNFPRYHNTKLAMSKNGPEKFMSTIQWLPLWLNNLSQRHRKLVWTFQLAVNSHGNLHIFLSIVVLLSGSAMLLHAWYSTVSSASHVRHREHSTNDNHGNQVV